MGPYDDDQRDNSDVQHDVNNGNLTESSLNPGTYYDGDGVSYDSDYNRID